MQLGGPGHQVLGVPEVVGRFVRQVGEAESAATRGREAESGDGYMPIASPLSAHTLTHIITHTSTPTLHTHTISDFQKGGYVLAGEDLGDVGLAHVVRRRPGQHQVLPHQRRPCEGEVAREGHGVRAEAGLGPTQAEVGEDEGLRAVQAPAVGRGGHLVMGRRRERWG